MAMAWYIIQAQTNCENKVKSEIAERAKKAGLDDKFGEILVPEEDVTVLVNGKKKIQKRRFYPGYVLVEMDFDDNAWHLVKKTPFVAGFVGSSNANAKPRPISMKDVNDIKSRINKSIEEPVYKIEFKAKDQVRFKEGSFKDFNGVVSSVDYDKAKVKVTITVFGRETDVEVDANAVEKVS